MDDLSQDRATATQVRRAVEDAAPELGLDLEEEPKGRKMVGALVPAAHSTQDVDDSEQPDSAGEDDDQAIAHLIETWEQIQHHEALDAVPEVTSDPYAAIAPTWTQLMDSESLKEWIESDEFQERKDEFTPADGATREVSDLEITYVGPSMANATYRSEEQGVHGVYLSQNAVILRKEEDGWRIAAITKHAQVTES